LVGDLNSQRSINGGSIQASNTAMGSASTSIEILALTSLAAIARISAIAWLHLWRAGARAQP
jgi:hypothetical protein